MNDLSPIDHFTALSIPAYSRLSSLGREDLLITMGLFSYESVNGSLGCWDLGREVGRRSLTSPALRVFKTLLQATRVLTDGPGACHLGLNSCSRQAPRLIQLGLKVIF